MGTTIYLRQEDGGSGKAWRAPPGVEVDAFDDDELNDDGELDLDQAWRLIDDALTQLGYQAAFAASDGETLSAERVQQLATQLAPLDWEQLAARGVELEGDDGLYLEHYWDAFRRYVADAASACNAIVLRVL